MNNVPVDKPYEIPFQVLTSDLKVIEMMGKQVETMFLLKDNGDYCLSNFFAYETKTKFIKQLEPEDL